MSEFTGQIADSCRETEAQLELLRSLPTAEQFRPTVSMALYHPGTRQIVLCAAADSEQLDSDLMFPQGGIEEGELALDAFLRELSEEAGVKEDCIESVHGLAGKALLGGVRDSRRKIILPLAGVAKEAAPLQPQAEEIGRVEWFSLSEAQQIIAEQPDSRRAQKTQAILARFLLVAEML